MTLQQPFLSEGSVEEWGELPAIADERPSSASDHRDQCLGRRGLGSLVDYCEIELDRVADHGRESDTRSGDDICRFDQSPSEVVALAEAEEPVVLKVY